MKYQVLHQTRYHYSEDVWLSHSLATCQPRATSWQECLAHQTDIDPVPQFWQRRRDVEGNWIRYFSLEEPHRVLTVRCHSQVEVGVRPVSTEKWSWETVVERLASAPEATRYRFPSPFVEADELCRDFAAPSFQPGRPVSEVFLELICRIHREFAYVPGSTAVHTPLVQVFRQRQGVCQDFAHLLIGCLRAFGLAARYVSGYLLTQPPPGQPRLVGADASHAWVACWLPDGIWLEGDPTNNCLCQQHHIVLAWGRDYQEVAPLRGVVLGGGHQRIEVSVDVAPQL